MKSWPPNSPDLNPIEHLWGAMKRILKNYKNLTKNEMINKIIQIWDEFPQEKINKLVLSFKKRLNLVLAKNGESISEELRNGLEKLPNLNIQIRDDIKKLEFNDLIETIDPYINDCPIQFHAKRPFTVEEDMLLLQMVEKFGKKWKQLENFFNQRTATSLRNRWNHLRK